MRGTALHFTYGNQSSMAFNVMQINFSDSLFQEELILPERTINSSMRRNSNIMDFYSIEYTEPLVFDMELLLGDKFKNEQLLHRDYMRQVIRWLRRDTYLPLVFETMPDVVFYAVMASDFVIYHNTNNQGYLKVTVTCNAPYGFTMVQSSPIYNNVDSNNIQIIANSDFDTSLIKTLIKKNGDGDILIKNTSNDSELNLVDLKDGDQIILSSFNRSISASDINGDPIIINDKKINHSWLSLWTEVNNITLTGDGEIQFLWQGTKVI